MPCESLGLVEVIPAAVSNLGAEYGSLTRFSKNSRRYLAVLRGSWSAVTTGGLMEKNNMK
jgi:hypothetical protein